jgi:hypothetical protein
MMSKAKVLAVARGISFNVSVEYLSQICDEQDGRCALTGELLTFTKTRDEAYTTGWNASLDRKNSDIGYEEGNVQWVTKQINLMKRDVEQADFIALCKKVAKYHEESK